MPTIDASGATLALLAARAPGATICPSEVARVLSAADWRSMMPLVHAAIDVLVADHRVELSWKGKSVPVRSGPYRIGRGAPSGDDHGEC